MVTRYTLKGFVSDLRDLLKPFYPENKLKVNRMEPDREILYGYRISSEPKEVESNKIGVTNDIFGMIYSKPERSFDLYYFDPSVQDILNEPLENFRKRNNVLFSVKLD